jgi:hypothetical protein
MPSREANHWYVAPIAASEDTPSARRQPKGLALDEETRLKNFLAPSRPDVEAGDHDGFVVDCDDGSDSVGGDQLSTSDAADCLHASFP